MVHKQPPDLSPDSQEEEGEVSLGNALDAPRLRDSLADHLQKSIAEAMSLAMGPMAAISQSIAQAFQQVQPAPLPTIKGKQAKPPKPHLTVPTVLDGVKVARKRTCLHQAESTWSWKCSRVQIVTDSESDPKSLEEAHDYVDYESDLD